jgi:hypothetical protein
MTTRRALAATLCSLAASAGLNTPSDASAAGGNIYLITGLHTYEATVSFHPGSCGTDYWHCDEVGHPANTGLDLTNTVSPYTATQVSFQSYGTGGYGYGTILDHVSGGSLCPGADVYIWIPYPNSAQGTWIGSVDFVQVAVTQTWGTQFLFDTAWTIQAIGSIYTSHPGGGCIWQGTHLHQSGPPGSHVWTNWSVESDDDPLVGGRQIWPTGSHGSNWLHWIHY